MTQNFKIDGLNSQSIWRSPAILAIAASLVGGGTSVYTVTRFQNQVNQKQEVTASIQPVVKTVTAMGRLEPKGEVAKLSAATANEGNRVDKLLVKEGDRVKIPGAIIPLGLYHLTRNATNLPIYMTLARAFMVLLLTIAMCIISGAIATRKVQSADPADMF